MSKLGIYTGFFKSIPRLSHPCYACIIAKVICLPRHPIFSTEQLDLGTCFHLGFSFFNKAYFQKLTSALTIADATTSRLFGYTKILKRPKTQLTRTFIQFSRHHG